MRLSPVLDNLNPAGRHVPRVVTIEGESCNVLSRIYGPEPKSSPIGSLSNTQTLIYACVYSCNADGYIRQRQVRVLVTSADPWVPTFVLGLLGEYVVEVADEIHRSIHLIPQELYQRYALANPNFIRVTCEGIVSYYMAGFSGWDRPFASSPSYAVMNELGVWDRRVAARLLRSR